MAGAVPPSGIGAGFVVAKYGPRVFVRESLGRYLVCVRDGSTWAEIVAECKTRAIADAASNAIDGAQ